MRGTALVYGDNINTDVIIPGKHTKTLDTALLAAHVMEDLDPSFTSRCRPGDFVVAGRNFGCGSSREQAPVALKAAGVGAVVARSFGRIFYRNAINIGLPLLECETSLIRDGDSLEILLGEGELRNLNSGLVLGITPLPPMMLAILKAGGLAACIRLHGGYPACVSA